jgi:hypothetical protein
MHSYESLILFLKDQCDQGNIKPHSARARKTAIKKVFPGSRFNSESLLTLDLDELILGFSLSEVGSKTNDSTINSYKSRIKRSIEDYIRVNMLGESLAPKNTNDVLINKKITPIDVKCRLRDGDFIVDVKNIPEDLDSPELESILKVIKATLNID